MPTDPSTVRRSPRALVLGVIGGSGIYGMEGLEDVREEPVETPYGPPSDAIVSGRLGETRLLFLPRHGRGHSIAPHRINFRANVCAMKLLGATHLVSLSAVGSMKETILPGHVVMVDQYIDFTRQRTSTFFEDEVVAHVSFADPVCSRLSAALAAAARRAGGTVHEGGTYLCMEGPQFSTRAESHLYRNWGVSVIGMTAMPEAKLAREAQLPYATLALATDFDCWHDSVESVSVEAVLAVLDKNQNLAKRAIAELAPALPDPSESPACRALDHSILTARDAIPESTRNKLRWLIGPYLDGVRK